MSALAWQGAASGSSHLRVSARTGCVALELCPSHLGALQACWQPFALWQVSKDCLLLVQVSVSRSACIHLLTDNLLSYPALPLPRQQTTWLCLAALRRHVVVSSLSLPSVSAASAGCAGRRASGQGAAATRKLPADRARAGLQPVLRSQHRRPGKAPLHELGDTSVACLKPVLLELSWADSARLLF